MNKKDQRIIKAISLEAWQKFGKKLYKTEERNWAMKEVLEKSLTADRSRFTDAQLDKLQTIKDSGMLEGTHQVEDEDVAKQYDEFVEKKMKEEIKRGNLSDPNKANKKVKQYARRTKKNKAGSDKESKGGNSERISST